jgi:hypothetical protein
MKKYLQEVMANPKFKKEFEQNEIFAMLVTAMNMEVQTEVEVVHFLCKQVKDLCNKLETPRVSVFEADPDSPQYRELMKKQLESELHNYKAKFGEAPTIILMGKDIQEALADHIIVSNRNIFKPEKSLFGIPLKDGVEGTIAFAMGER